MGADIDSRNDPYQHVKKLQNAVAELISSFDHFTRAPPLYKIYSTPGFKRSNKAIDEMFEIGQMYTNGHLERIRESAKTGEKVYGMSLLEQWLIDDNMTEQEAVRDAIVMMSAGTDVVRFST